jgi:hypothetical protein
VSAIYFDGLEYWVDLPGDDELAGPFPELDDARDMAGRWGRVGYIKGVQEASTECAPQGLV